MRKFETHDGQTGCDVRWVGCSGSLILLLAYRPGTKWRQRQHFQAKWFSSGEYMEQLRDLV
jgi:hypothetical protein